MMNFEKLTKVP